MCTVAVCYIPLLRSQDMLESWLQRSGFVLNTSQLRHHSSGGRPRGVGDSCRDDVSHTTSQRFCSHMLSVVRKWKRRLLLAGNICQNAQKNKEALGQDLTFSSPSSQNLTTFPMLFILCDSLFASWGFISCSLFFAPLGLNIKPISGSLLYLRPQRFLTRA